MHDDARAAFEGFVADAQQGNRLILSAYVDGRLVGTVQVLLALMPNQPHRGEIAKTTAAYLKANGSIITDADLRSYEPFEDEQLDGLISRKMWNPVYRPYRRSPHSVR